jgi:hypothetical protein
MAYAAGGLVDVAQYLAAQGRHGDSMLAHITPDEADLLKRHGGSGTINPVTGLPEFFLKKAFREVKRHFKNIASAAKKVLKSPVGRILATVALATVLGPAGVGLSMGMAGGLAGAGTTLAAGGSLKEALVSGAMGYVGGGGTIMGASPISAVGQYLPGTAGSALNTGLATAAIGTGVGKVAGMSTADALKMGAMSGASAAALQGLQNMSAAQTAQATQAPQATSGQGLRMGGSEQGINLNSPPSDMGLKMPDVSGMNQAAGAAPADFGLVPGAPPPPSGPMDTLAAGAKKFYGEYLSPSRPGLPSDAGTLQRYGPLLATAGAASAFMPKKPSNQSPLFAQGQTGFSYMRENPDLFRGGLGMYQPPQEGGGTIVPTPSYSGYQPMYEGIMSAPGLGMQQYPDYNQEGLYGVPQMGIRGYADGGELRETSFPRKTGAIDGPGTGTSDSIPAMLSDGEFVFTARAVRNAGGGSRRKGAARMYKLMKMLEGGPVKAK